MIWLLVFIFILGLCVGSFLNVLIYRFPRNLPITGRSFCPKCKKKISWYDNIPLLSFFLLRGKCRSCHSPISWQYPFFELLTGILFVIGYQGLSGDIRGYQGILGMIGWWFILSALVVIFVTDLRHEIILDQVVYPAILVGFFLQITNYQLLITNYFPTGLIAGLFFLGLHLITRGRGMGLGDAKLAFLMGLILGYPRVILAFYFAFLTGVILGVILILAGKKKFGQQIPFGPFLAVSTVIALFWGEEILQWMTARLF